jgi:hypothetical protein
MPELLIPPEKVEIMTAAMFPTPPTRMPLLFTPDTEIVPALEMPPVNVGPEISTALAETPPAKTVLAASIRMPNPFAVIVPVSVMPPVTVLFAIVMPVRLGIIMPVALSPNG